MPARVLNASSHLRILVARLLTFHPGIGSWSVAAVPLVVDECSADCQQILGHRTNVRDKSPAAVGAVLLRH